jgi:hypothetical protein
VPQDTLDFIVIGSARCGTTSLWKHLDSHPQICTPPDKERPFFSIDKDYERGLQWYMGKMFVPGPDDAKYGTVTGGYMAGREEQVRTTASRMRETVPDVRLVALLRDPIERAIAAYRQQTRRGVAKKSFEDTFLPPIAAGKPVLPEAVGGGEYGRILSIYLDVFPRDQLLVKFTDELETRPKRLMREVFEFIGVDPAHVPPDLDTRYRQGGMETRVSPEAVESLLGYMNSEVWPYVDDPGRRRQRGFKWWFKYIWNITPDEQGKEISDEAREMLKAHYLPDIEVLRERVGVEPPWAPAYEGVGDAEPAPDAEAGVASAGISSEED